MSGNPARGLKKAVKQPPLLFDRTQEIVGRIEKQLGHSFLAYWNSPNGSVCHNDVLGFYETLQQVGRKDKISLFIKSDGGTGQASLRIVHLLRQYTPWLAAIVPLECASAATMLALGADEIHMGPLSYLTAIDTSIRHDLSPIDVDNHRVAVGLDELSRVINLWRKETKEADPNPYQAVFQYVNPLVVGAVDRASSLSIKLCTEILSYHLPDRERATKISEHLNSNYPTHTYPITFSEASRIGLNVKPLDLTINDLLLELNELYSEMGQRARTDFDEQNHHDNEILNIIEGRHIQVYYQNDQDWHYRKEERRWVSLNDESSWRKLERHGSRVRKSIFHIR
jgi:hypothetical protein